MRQNTFMNIVKDPDWALCTTSDEYKKVIEVYNPSFGRICADKLAVIDALGIRSENMYNLNDLPGLINFNYPEKMVEVYRTATDYVDCKTTNMKVGRYLRTIGKTDAEVREISNHFTSYCEIVNGIVLKIAETPEQCAHVYINGPSSCMTHSLSCGDSPAVAYGNEWCGVAYVEIAGHIVARAVVSYGHDDTNRTYTDIYGNRKLLEPLLHAANYSDGESFEGVHLNRVESNDDIICPYLDFSPSSVTDTGEYLVVDSCGVNATNTSGLFEDRRTCDECSDRVDTEEIHYVESVSAEVCDDCIHRYYIRYNDEYYHHDHHDVVNIDGDYYHTDDDDVVCDYEGDWIMSDDAIWVGTVSEYALSDDTCLALVGHDEEESCLTKDTVQVRDTCVHDDFLDEYNETYQDLFEDAA